MLTTTDNMAQRTEPSEYYHHHLSVILATLSLFTMLLVIPPMVWHFRHRNVGATSLVAWSVIMLLFNFINAIIWRSDNIATWYDGVGLCDVEVRINLAAQVAIASSFACIMRALAAVLDTDNATLGKTRAQKRRAYAIDLLWCVGIPLLQLLFHYIVQQGRYFIFSVTGCMPSVASSWLTILLLLAPQFLWLVIATYFAILTSVRLYRYRLTFSSILASTNSNKSRFMRLYLLCFVWIFLGFPIGAYPWIKSMYRMRGPFNWNHVHNPKIANEVVYVNTHGVPLINSWFPIILGSMVFVFFGFGKEAIEMYKSCLTAIGLGCCVSNRHVKETKKKSVLGGKIKMIFNEKGVLSMTSWSSSSSRSPCGALSPNDNSFTNTENRSVATICGKDVDQGLKADGASSSHTKVGILESPTTSSKRSTIEIPLQEVMEEEETMRGDSTAETEA